MGLKYILTPLLANPWPIDGDEQIEFIKLSPAPVDHDYNTNYCSRDLLVQD